MINNYSNEALEKVHLSTCLGKDRNNTHVPYFHYFLVEGKLSVAINKLSYNKITINS